MEQEKKIPVVTIDDHVVWMTTEQAEKYKKSVEVAYEACKPTIKGVEGKIMIYGTAGEISGNIKDALNQYINGINRPNEDREDNKSTEKETQ